MLGTSRLNSSESFTLALYAALQQVNPGIADLALYEFRYGLEHALPEHGWDAVELLPQAAIEQMIASREFYASIQLKPRRGDKIVLDEQVLRLTQVLLAGLATGAYPASWVRTHFYFDIRGFLFFPRTVYFTAGVLRHFGGQPYAQFEPRQARFEHYQGVGYNDFMQANAEVDGAFIQCVQKIIAVSQVPLLILIAGPTAAGKTEITERLRRELERTGSSVTSIEVDNFMIDRERRDERPMGKEAMHFEIFIHSLQDILQGKKIAIPRYDFIKAASSHDLDGNLRPGCQPLIVEPADIIFMEGNFTFQIEEISRLIGIKVVYLTDDPIRLKRKWKRDIDYRQKYDPAYFKNRYFRTQFLRADEIYLPLLEQCDLCVDTTGAALWASPDTAAVLNRS
jgi:uridine kinase